MNKNKQSIANQIKYLCVLKPMDSQWAILEKQNSPEVKVVLTTDPVVLVKMKTKHHDGDSCNFILKF